MTKHSYLSHIEPQLWDDLTTIKEEMDTSFNKLINDGCRLIVKDKFQNISQMKKQRNSMSNWTR